MGDVRAPRLAGKAALITGAASGIGRSAAIRMAQEGADIIALDLPTPKARGDLDTLAAEIAALGRRVSLQQADVRNFASLESAVNAGVADIGRIDILCPSAGVFTPGKPSWEMDEAHWDLMNDVNSKGVWLTCKAAIPHMIAQGQGGSIILINSAAGLIAVPGGSAYAVSKHGNVGLMRSLALEVAPHNIRVNSIHPGTVATPMVMNDATFQSLRPDLDAPTQDDVGEAFKSMFALPINWIESVDVANAVLFLASDEARYITGTELKVDAGYTLM